MKLAIVLVGALAFAQSTTVLMQRATYLEETVGDLDGAIQIYRQILAGGSEARGSAADAQYRLGAALLKKGNTAQAARAFQDLMRKFPEETGLVNQASIHYVDPVGYSFTIPTGWGMRPRAPFGGGNGGPGSCVDLQDPENQATANICAKPEKVKSGTIDERLLRGENERVQMRMGRNPNFILRAGSPKFGWSAGQRTLTIVGDFSIGANRSTEWVTWVQTENSRSSVVVVTNAENFDAFQARFLPILNSFRLP